MKVRTLNGLEAEMRAVAKGERPASPYSSFSAFSMWLGVSRAACFAAVVLIVAPSPTGLAQAQDIAIRGRAFYKDGKPWVLKGVDVAGLSKSSRKIAEDKGAALAKAEWNDAEIGAIKNILRLDTLRLQVSPAGLDPQSPDHDPSYATEIRDNVATAKKLGFAVILTMDAQQDHPIGSPEGCMPSDDSVRAWQALAPSFVHDSGVMLEVFDEPCKSGGNQNKVEWARDMQSLIDTLRGLGSTNILILDGLWYSRMTNGLFPLVHDSLPNRLALAAHPYFIKGAFETEKQWRDQFGASAEKYPFIATEWNATSTHGCVGPDTPAVALSLMRYLEKLHVGIVGWAIESNYGKLVKDHTSFEPTNYSTFTDCTKAAGESGAGALFANFPND